MNVGDCQIPRDAGDSQKTVEQGGFIHGLESLFFAQPRQHNSLHGTAMPRRALTTQEDRGKRARPQVTLNDEAVRRRCYYSGSDGADGFWDEQQRISGRLSRGAGMRRRRRVVPRGGVD